jgi:hypothetical protein
MDFMLSIATPEWREDNVLKLTSLSDSSASIKRVETLNQIVQEASSQSCSVASCLWCLQIQIEGLPSQKQVFCIYQFTTSFSPDHHHVT